MKNKKIELDKNFYNIKAVKKSIEVFDDLADFDLKVEKNKIVINLKNIDKEVEKNIKEEFCNYVLAKVKNE